MAKNPAKGTLLKATISSVLTTVAQRLSLDGPSMEVGQAETTDLDSGAWKTYRPTIADGGEVSGTLLYDPADTTHAFLFTQIGAPTVIVWNIVFADAAPTTFSFSGFLTKLAPTGIEVEANLEAEFAIKVTGAVTKS